ncbi:hypothetical protein [Streptomyces sp. NPDC093109]|uniref:hypothetical protein n=1 Tax=Streptomyces sp. NPDC093109 TaxID=3154977 RepID=UPI0034506B9B
MSNDQQYPYGGQGAGSQGSQGAQGSQESQGAQGWTDPQQPAQGQGQGQREPVAAQTWEGQTWDTQYQPQIQRIQPQAASPASPASQAPQAPQAPHQAHQASPAAPAAQTAYLPPQGAYGVPQPAPGGTGAVPGAAPGAAPGAVPGGTPGAAPGSAPAGAAAPADTSGYGAPTTLGNTRMTDAQRARAEGRSPIIPPGIQPAALTALLGLLLAGGAAIGSYALLVPLVLLQAVTAAGWFRLNGMWPARQGIALAFLGGLVSDVVLLAAGRENGSAAILGTLGVWVLLVVVLQLRSRAGADERMMGLMAAVASAALAILATGHLAAVPDAVVVGTLAVAAATVVRALPLPSLITLLAAPLAGAGAGLAVVGVGMTDLSGADGGLIGLGAGICALIGLRAASYDYPSKFVHMTAGVALPLTAAAPAVYLLGRMLA